MKKLLIASLILLVCITANLFAGPADVVLKEYGRSKGLCVVLGAGSHKKGDLCAQLAKKSGMVVHGIAGTLKHMEAARTAADKARVSGQVQIEQVKFNPLPYVNNLVNVLVIENTSAAKGLKEAEIQRVVAPGGLICKGRNGKFRFTRKKRPSTMGTWPLPVGDPGWNRTSTDKEVPVNPGIHWQDGLPINFNLWAACRAYVINATHCFTLGTTELENLDPLNINNKKRDMYLTARDAYSGLPLWKINTKTDNDGKALTARNPAPLAADSEYVYAYKDGKINAFAGETGKITKSFPVAFPTVRMVLKDNILIAAGWKTKRDYGLWHPWVTPSNDAKLEAFDTKTGRKLWAVDGPCQDIVVDGNRAFALMHFWDRAPRSKDNIDPTLKTNAEVRAYDLRSGKKLWVSADASFKTEVDPWLSCAGSGIVVINRYYNNPGTSVLAAESGALLWKQDIAKGKPWAIVVDGRLWLGWNQYDPRTGKKVGGLEVGRAIMCTPPTVAADLISSGRDGKLLGKPGSKTGKGVVGAARAACIEGFALANGKLYTGQNNCQCSPQHVPGFMAFGVSPMPAAADYTKARPLIMGKGRADTRKAKLEADAWPIFLGNAERTGVIQGKLSRGGALAWQRPATGPRTGALADVWTARARAVLSAPVTGYGKVICAALEEGKVIALDAASGKVRWSYKTGARIDTPPSLDSGLAIFGCRNGWIYALSVSDGELAWKTRLAPIEQRMMAFGQIESVWPVPGSVLIDKGIVYASGGKTSENSGGLAVLALQAVTGKQKWARSVGSPFTRQNDLLAMKDGKLMLRHMSMDPATGAGSVPANTKTNQSALEGMADGTWTYQYSRRSGNLAFGKLTAHMLVRDEGILYGVTNNRGLNRFAIPEGTAAGISKLQAGNCKWYEKAGSGQQFEAMLKCGNTLVLAGRKSASSKLTGFIVFVDAATGKSIKETALPAPVVYQGLAVLNGRIYAALQNGTVVCVR